MNVIYHLTSVIYHHLFLNFHHHPVNNWSGVLGFPSLKTVLGIYSIEKEAALVNTGSNPLPISVKLYSTLTGYSDAILLLMIPSRSSSRRRSVRTFISACFLKTRILLHGHVY